MCVSDHRTKRYEKRSETYGTRMEMPRTMEIQRSTFAESYYEITREDSGQDVAGEIEHE